MPKGYVVANLTITDPQKFAVYSPLASAAIEQFGGRVVARGKTEVLEGSPLARTLVIEFDDYDTAVKWYRSAEYEAAIRMREGAADITLVVVDGV